MKRKLTEKDFLDDAAKIGCEIEAIMAVATVESGGRGGFYDDGHPVILFEPHVFHAQTGGKYSKSHPHLSYAKWGERKYPNTAGVRKNFNEASALDWEAAVKSTSWGIFQVMGFNWKALGYDNVRDFYNQMQIDENAHLEAFTRFIMVNKLDDELRDKKWAAFAQRYNGPGYAVNKYDIKMSKEYDRLKKLRG